MKLAFTYAFLAAIAMVANIGAQDLAIRLYFGSQAVLVSVAVGTIVGLFVKYVLDKRYIFRFRARNMAHDGRTFLFYASAGVATTAIFWGFEFMFHWLFATKEMRYLGGAVGLAIGYFTKYHLDKRIAFRSERASPFRL